jgi:ATP-binding cassette subfamily B protein
VLRFNELLKMGGAVWRKALLPDWLPGELRALRRAFFTQPKALTALSGMGRYMPELIAASMVLNLLGLALPLTLLQVYDRILPNTATDTLTALAIGIVVAVTLETALRITRSAVTGWTSGRFEHMASTKAFKSLLRVPLEVFEGKGTGVHMETLNAIHTLKDFYSGQAYLAVFDFPFALIYLLLLMAFGGRLVLVPIVLMAAFCIAGLVMGRHMHGAIARRMASDDQRVNFIVEVLTGIHAIKALAMEAPMMRRYERLLENSSQSEFAVSELSAKAQSLALLFSHLSTILVVAFGCTEVINGHMTAGVLAACSLLGGRCIQPMQAALDRWNRFQTARLAEERLSAMLAEQDDTAGPVLPPIGRISGAMTFDNLTVKFSDGPTVLDNVDFHMESGEMIGISGENGVGKSTLLLLMAGVVAPTSGAVLVDGCNLAGFDPLSLRSTISYIPQRPELFNGTILENLTQFEPSRAAKAKELARDLGIDRFVARLPSGYDTVVGEGAQESLPRGIRQLVSIVRALAVEPRIVLFDEANSAVDGAGDQALHDLFKALKGQLTVVLMTSRPSMLRLADRALKLIDGKLVDPKAAGAAPSPFPLQAPRPPAPMQGVVQPVPAIVQPVPASPVASPPPVSSPAKSDPRDVADGEIDRFEFLREIEGASPFGRCLWPLVQAMKWAGDPRDLAEALPHFAPALDTVAFRNVMANLGYGNSTVTLLGQQLDARVLPCLFIDSSGRPMVLSQERGGEVVAYDPESRSSRPADPAGHYGTAYFFTPLETAQAPSGQWFKRVLSRFHGLVWALLGQSLIINLLALGVPFFTMSIYDKVIATGDMEMLAAFMVGVLIVIASDEVLRDLRSKASAYVGARISYIVASTVFERTLLLPLAMTERASIGSQLARFKDLESLRDFFGGGIASVIIDLPFVVVYLVVLVLLGGSVALVPVVALLIFAVVVVALMPVVRKRVATSGRAVTRRQEFVVESLLKMRALRYAGLEVAWGERFRNHAAQAAMGGYDASMVSGVLACVSQAMVVLSGMATMTVGVYEVLQNNMTPGALIASMMVVWRVLAPMQTGFSLVQRVEQTRASINQLEALTAYRTEHDGRLASSTLALKGAVTFSRVSLRYSADADPALLGVSFEALPGQVIAILGPDGAGKSTVLKLIAGLYAPQAGNVMIDDLDIRQIDPIELRKCIGYAPQVPQLFFGTIAQNLRLAHPVATESELRHALTLAGVWDEVAALPRGLGTRVGDSRSNRVSTSLAQGMSLARAYLKKSPIMLLDEPVTGLDFDGDRCFREFVESMRGKATIFVVTHRPSHLSLADQIIVLEKGAVRAAGPAAEIRAKLG